MIPFSPMPILDASVALITGAATALGAALARGLVDSGATVYVADADLDAAARLAVTLGPGARSIRLRPGEPLDWRVARAAIVGECGRLNIVVRCDASTYEQVHIAHAAHRSVPA
jgi:NAD(P)-dependent dehydrogenase (short-subunit alcohol dehydrogenase family)